MGHADRPTTLQKFKTDGTGNEEKRSKLSFDSREILKTKKKRKKKEKLKTTFYLQIAQKCKKVKWDRPTD